MTNGPDHYREAERLLRLADTERGLVAFAQVHATLAQAAAVATLASVTRAAHDVMYGAVDDAWATVAETGATAHPGGAA
jgi:hypothetical protein